MFKTIIENWKQEILEDTYRQAEVILKNAEIEADKLVHESEILKQIRKAADGIKAETIDNCKKLQEKMLKEESSIYSIYKYSRVNYINFNLWAVTDIQTHKTGIIDIHGTQIIPCIYDEIPGILDGTNDILVSNSRFNSSLYGLVNNLGKTIIEPKYSDFECGFRNGVWAVKLENKWGYVDRNDNVVIPFQYDKADSFSNNTAKVELNGLAFYIDKEGNRIEK